ncbi:MAG: FAD:protein FMN transferase [Oligoflexia bacterium]|nr:FAD:protein FMN transferase [Oligoflexia bacterium]
MQQNNASHEGRRVFLKKLFLGGAGAALGLSAFQVGKGLKNGKTGMPRLYSQRHSAMGTWVSITLFSTDEEQAFSAMSEAFAEVRKIDQLMSIHQASSQVSAINRAAGQEAVKVDPRLIEVLGTAIEHSRLTQGRYDVTILPVMRLFGFYGAAPVETPRDAEIARALDSVGYRHVQVDRVAGTVGLARRGSAIDLGSIGKGYAVERAAAVLQRRGISSALIDAGGNLYAMGAPHEDTDPRAGWTVGIRDPRGEARAPLKTLVLRDQAVATSGVDQTKVRIGSREIGHIFDAVTGKPRRDWLSCTAVARTGTRSDALSTAAYILGQRDAEAAFGGEGVQFHFFG